MPSEDSMRQQRDADTAAWLRRMTSDFAPRYTMDDVAKPEIRVADAMEYIAFQLGQINRKLDGVKAGPAV